MTDLVVLSLEAWDGVWRRNQHLIAGLLRAGHVGRVLFVEPAADPLYALVSRRRSRIGSGLRTVEVAGVDRGRLSAYQPTKVLPRRLDPGVDRRIAHAIRRAVGRLGLVDPILWVNDPSGAAVVESVGWPSLYDITDDWLAADRTPAEHARLIRDEAILIERCAEVVVCSRALETAKGGLRDVTLIPNAVDVEDYLQPRPRPADLPGGSVAVYVGTVHRDRIDVELCAATAELLGDRGTLVLVGPAPLDTQERDTLTRAGVVLLGAKDRTEVPAYLQHADVLVVPHVVTSFTESLDPIKLYEYRAVGRPVVSTPVAGFRESDDARVTITGAPDFPGAVLRAIPATSVFPEGADGHVDSWDDRIDRMRQVIERVAARRTRSAD
ncbi:glycosyltransferase [Raineyella fluvialis]|uniref:Glycosyltransferase n=1 Tax=Raineyella fluvialis TaxID=2662261 RepID=A0A5Q2FEH2_9ACTN|nr:glycosyltransferase [Raineyella fluvialis]QGF23884.1 glycosyltransferase [Raineyella fluvialis]